MSYALTFPGQGSQSVGMGQEIAAASAEARAVFDAVDDALGGRLSDVIFSGPEEALKLTANTQPALMAVSLAVLRAAEAQGFDLTNAAYVAGHSLGEYSALCAAGALSVEDTAKLLRIRGNAMQEAVAPGEGAMAAFIGADLAQAEAIAESATDAGSVCEVANDNAPGQIVLSGHKAAVERAIENAKTAGIKRAVLLPVSAPFHCSLMRPAAVAMEQALANVEIKSPIVPIVTNVTATATQDPELIRQSLVEQVTGRVRWRETVSYLSAQGVGTVYEIGAGKVLTGLVRRISKDMTGSPVSTPDEVAGLASL